MLVSPPAFLPARLSTCSPAVRMSAIPSASLCVVILAGLPVSRSLIFYLSICSVVTLNLLAGLFVDPRYVRRSVYLSACFLAYLSAYLPVCLSVCLSACLAVGRSIGRSVCLRFVVSAVCPYSCPTLYRALSSSLRLFGSLLCLSDIKRWSVYCSMLTYCHPSYIQSIV